MALIAGIMTTLFAHSALASESKLDLAWNHYLSTLDGVKLQPGCYPKRVAPPEGIRHQGTVILLHGYSACPQQYFAWADILARKGFEVLMPVLPGHGHQQVLPGSDDYFELPNLGNWNEYDQFADQINTLAKAATGIRVIGGLSVGAAVAVDATNKEPELYDRQIIISPYLESSNHFSIPNIPIHWAPVKEILDLEVSTSIDQTQMISWGAGCLDEIRRGRQGICQFELGNIGAITKFGNSVLKATHPASHTETQVVFVEDDPTADNGDQIALIHNLGNVPNISACTLPKGVNHSAISRFDAPDQDKWWIPGLLQSATEFVVNGERMPLAGPSILKSFQQCDVGCTKEDAAQFNCSLAN